MTRSSFFVYLSAEGLQQRKKRYGSTHTFFFFFCTLCCSSPFSLSMVVAHSKCSLRVTALRHHIFLSNELVFFFSAFPFFFFAFFDQAIGQLKPQGVEAHFIVATCENMVSEKAMRPGDILTASNGKTIEVLAPLALLLFLFYYL